MGTRADFYVGRGLKAEWLGSIAWDGNPSGIDKKILNAVTTENYRKAVEEFLASREDGTKPSQGWPWPWNDSNTTDYAYAFHDGFVMVSNYGGPWFNPNEPKPKYTQGRKQEFPNMKAIKTVDYGERSGLIVLQSK